MERAIVGIVGRPNVGKSTLFNRIVGKRISITEDTPGVTRDRIYAEAEWLNNHFTLVDTGGLDPDDEDIMMKNIRSQAQVAIDTADVIIFVVDGRDGLTGTDREIGELLRVSGKKIIVAANRMDTGRITDEIYEFYELGLGEPMIISAEQALGIGDLLDEVIASFPEDADTDEEEDIIKVSFIGKPNVGKSSTINNILGEDRVIVTNIPGTTRDSIDTYFEFERQKYMFIDTAGLRRKRSIDENVERYSVIRTLASVDRSDVCVLIIDATSGVTEQDTKIAGYAHEQGKAIIIAINKWDLIEKENKTTRQFEKSIRDSLGFILYAPIIFVSAKTGQRMNDLLKLINTVYDNYNLRISTGVLNDIVNRAVMMNQPPSDKGRSCKIFYASQVSVQPPKFVFFVKNSDLMHFSYERYLENQIRDHFGFLGAPLRFEFRERGEA